VIVREVTVVHPANASFLAFSRSILIVWWSHEMNIPNETLILLASSLVNILYTASFPIHELSLVGK